MVIVALHGYYFEGFDFEELTDRDISDALLDIRDKQEREERKKIEERRKKRNRRKEKINRIITLGNRVKVYDTAIILVCLITAVTLGIAWMSTITTKNLSVNMQTRSEKVETADELWASLHDISIKYKEVQLSLLGYTKGEIETNKISFELSNFIEESVTTRQKFETVDLPTYSVYKFRIDEFIAKRMLLAEKVLEDIEADKISSNAITEFLELETDFSTFEDVKEDFYKQLNLNN